MLIIKLWIIGNFGSGWIIILLFFNVDKGVIYVKLFLLFIFRLFEL